MSDDVTTGADPRTRNSMDDFEEECKVAANPATPVRGASTSGPASFLRGLAQRQRKRALRLFMIHVG